MKQTHAFGEWSLVATGAGTHEFKYGFHTEHEDEVEAFNDLKESVSIGVYLNDKQEGFARMVKGRELEKIVEDSEPQFNKEKGKKLVTCPPPMMKG